jgi:hypothetical protein
MASQKDRSSLTCLRFIEGIQRAQRSLDLDLCRCLARGGAGGADGGTVGELRRVVCKTKRVRSGRETGEKRVSGFGLFDVRLTFCPEPVLARARLLS